MTRSHPATTSTSATSLNTTSAAAPGENSGPMPTPRTPAPRPAGERSVHSRALRISVARPEPGLSLVHLRGEIDLSTTERLAELIHQRMNAVALRGLVLDLTGITFCGSCGIELLVHAQCRAEHRDIAMHVVPGTGAVARMLDLVGIGERFRQHPDTAHALAAARR